MKILQVSPYAMSRPGGVQTHIRDLSDWLISQGHEVRIIAPPGPAHVKEHETVLPFGHCRTISLHGTSFEISRASRRELRDLQTQLTGWGADHASTVMHLHTPWTPMMPWQVWRKMAVPSVATFHATLPTAAKFDPMDAFLRRAASYFNKRLAQLIVPSDAPRQQWIAAGAAPVPAILPPTINLCAWREAGTKSIRTPAKFRIVYMGRLEARKGVDVLLCAWPEIRRAVPNAELIIAGDGELRTEIAARIATFDGSDVSLRPPPSNTEAHRLIANADIFAAPALHGESFGLVLIEAMAAGTLPVAANNAGFATVMTGEGAELLVPAGDAGALAQKIIALAGDPTRRDALQTWATKHANNFDVATVGPQYLTLYQSLK